MSSTQQEAVVEKVTVKGPNKYQVIFLNDNVTPMDYVVQCLVTIFGKTADESKDITIEVHEKGRSIAGIYSYEVAEQKCIETVTDARTNGFPLDVIMEEQA